MKSASLTRAQVREIDRRAMEEFGVPGLVLMENAGRGAAELLMKLNPERQPTTVICGPGNNGGDGFVIARLLHNNGWPVRIACTLAPVQYQGDAAVNYRRASDCKIEIQMSVVVHDGWIVDAIFGTGLSRPITAPHDVIINHINSIFVPVLAIDIPSGLDCDTGEPLGVCVRATHTATFVARKKGFDNPASLAYTGEVHVIDIGVPRILVDQYIK